MRRLLDSLVTFISWHRRAVGAILAGLAVLLLAHTLASPGETIPVVVLTEQVPAGHLLTEAQVTRRDMPAEHAPASRLTETSAAAGEATTVDLSPGTVLQPGLLARGDSIAPGRAVVPISVRDDGLRQLLRPGDIVSLVAAGGEAVDVLTRDARVVALPTLASNGSAVEMASARGEEIVLVEVPSDEAPLVAAL